MRTFFVCAVTFLLASTAFAADTLDIYVIDTEGGKSMVMVTPAGEKMLVDGGSPSRDDRDGKRVLAAADSWESSNSTISWSPTTTATTSAIFPTSIP